MCFLICVSQSTLCPGWDVDNLGADDSLMPDLHFCRVQVGECKHGSVSKLAERLHTRQCLF